MSGPVAAAAAQDPVYKRRMLSQRSHTVAVLPPCNHLLNESDDESGEKSRLLPASSSEEQTPTKSCRHNSLEGDKDDGELRPLGHSLVCGGSGSTGSSKTSVRMKRTRFETQYNVMITEPELIRESRSGSKRANHSTPNIHAYHHAHLKSLSTTSNLLSRVKERIREKVFQSSEWPNAAAIIQEKRARANIALETSFTRRTDLDIEQINLHELTKKKSTRSKSDSSKYDAGASGGSDQSNVSKKGEQVRAAFIRRRSISEDTYDRQPCEQLNTGVLCSNEDLQAIVNDRSGKASFGSRLRRTVSPSPMKKHMRAQSLDSARLTHHAGVIEPTSPGGGSRPHRTSTLSVESSSSTISSRTIDSEGGCGGSTSEIEPSNVPKSSASPLPEVVLDGRRLKEVIMEESFDMTSSTESLPSVRKKAELVPEVVFDEYGQTWDVYGAEFDPEIVGVAIQRHLERIMRRNSEPGSRSSPTSCQPEIKRTQSMETPNKSRETPFWFRFLCLFTSREVTS